MEVHLDGDEICYVFEDTKSDTSENSSDDIDDVIDSLSCDVHPVVLVMHVKCQHDVQHTDISLESVIDKSSNLDIAKFGVKNEISKFNSSCNSQQDLLLEMSNDDLDITVCSPSMTSSPKLVKVLLFCLFSMKLNFEIKFTCTSCRLYFS